MKWESRFLFTEMVNRPSVAETTERIRLPEVSNKATTAPTRGAPVESVTLPLNWVVCATAEVSKSKESKDERKATVMERIGRIDRYPDQRMGTRMLAVASKYAV